MAGVAHSRALCTRTQTGEEFLIPLPSQNR
jgi:hypothetical protein